MQKQAIEFNQFGLKMYLLTLTIEELVDNSYVNIFNSETGEGYQRPVSPTHYKKITKYFRDEETPILPPTILAAIDKEDITFSNNSLIINDCLRLVDGQHRIEALKYLKQINNSRYNELKHVEMPVTLLSIENNQVIHEINTFIDINSKGKKVSTDLAIRLRDKLRNHAGYYKSHKDLIEAIATKVALFLNNEDKLSVWYGAIKTGPEVKGAIISINAFCRSLSSIIEKIVETNVIDYKQINVENVNDIVESISILVNEIWDTVKNNWGDCFEKSIPMFKKSYNLQKGTGTYSIHLLFNECLEKNEGNKEKAMMVFKEYIKMSGVESEDWLTGGNFSGYSSESGFRYIANEIKNKALVQ